MNKLFYNKFEMNIPDEFEAVKPDDYKKLYNNAKIDYAFTANENTNAICLTQTGAELVNDQVEERIVFYRNIYSRMIPGFTFGEMRKRELNGHEIALMTYKSNALTKDLYNMLAILSLEDKEVLILFSCDLNDAIKYMYVFVNILDSIEFVI